MQVFCFGLMIVASFSSTLYSTPIEVSAYTKGKRKIFLMADYHDHLYVGNNHDFDEARCEWSHACINLLTEKNVQYRVLVEDKAVFANRIKHLFGKNVSIEQIENAVDSDALEQFISVFSALGLDSHLTDAGVDLINITSTIGLTLSKMVYELHKLKENYKKERDASEAMMDVFSDLIDRAASQLGLIDTKDSTYLSYTFNQLLSELSLLRDSYEKVLVICESFKNKSNWILESYQKALNELDLYIKKINVFLKENKLKENLYQPIYTILKNKFIELKTSKNTDSLKFIEALSDIMFYPQKYVFNEIAAPCFIRKDRDLQAINKIFETSDDVPIIAFMGASHTKNIGEFLKEGGFKEEVLGKGYLVSEVGKTTQVVACSAKVLELVKNYKKN